MKYLYIILFLLLSISCKNSLKPVVTDLVKLNVPDEIPDTRGKLSEYFQKLTYIPLETNENSIIGPYPNFEIIAGDILATSARTGRMLFSQQTGHYVRTIGKQGRGPGEYSSVGIFVSNTERQTVYMGGNGYGVIEYDLGGNFLKEIQIPLSCGKFGSVSSPERTCFLDDSLYCAFFSNNFGYEKKRVLVFDTLGRVVNLFPNHRVVDGLDWHKLPISLGGSFFYRYDHKTYFKEKFCDTIFRVTRDSLISHAIIDFGKNSVPFYRQYDADYDRNSHLYPLVISENEKYLYFRFYRKHENVGLYNKSTLKLEIYNTQSGFEDDINHFVNVQMKGVLPDGRAIGILDAYDVCEWFGNHDASQLSVELQKLKGIKEDDNPVVVIME